MATITDARKQVVQQAYDAWDQGHPDVFDEVYAPDVVHRNLDIGGVDDLKSILREWFKAFPDLSHTVHAMFVEGDWVTTHFTISGTHQGEWQGLKPTNAKFAFDGVGLERVENGKIVERWLIEDMLTFYRQLGAAKLATD